MKLMPYQRKPVAEINVVPYIDVMLVLLVVFMVTAPLLTQGLNIQLPDEAGDPIDQELDPIIVSVDQDSRYYLNVANDPTKPVELLEIQDMINKTLNNRPNAPVLIEGDSAVPYGSVVHLMAVLQQAGAPNLGLITEPSSATQANNQTTSTTEANSDKTAVQ